MVIDTEMEETMTNRARQLVEEERKSDKERQVKGYFNKIFPLDEIRTGKVSKYVFESLTK